MTTTSSTTPNPTRVDGRSRLAVAGVTTIAAVAWWAILAKAAGIDLQAKQGSSTVEVGAVSVLSASLAMAFAGWALLAILERKTIAARKAWTIVAIIACVMSLGSPLTSGIGTGAKLALASLHLLVGATVILGLRRTALSTTERCQPTP